MPIAPLTFMDTFSRTLASGWGTSDSGFTWANQKLSLSQDSGKGLITSTTGSAWGTVRVPLPYSNVSTQTNNSVLTRFRFTSSARYPLTDFGPMLSHNGSNTFYYFAIQGNWSEIAIGVYVNGYRYEMNRKSFSISRNVEYWARFERRSTGMRAKIWRVGTAEPTSWTVTSRLWDGSQHIGKGSPGFFNKGTRDTYNVEVFEFYHYASSPSEPNVLPSDTFSRTVTEGWGLSSSKHTWTGSFGVDPAYYKVVSSERGNVSETFGRITTTANGFDERVGWLGQNIGGDIEAYAKVLSSATTSGTAIRLGLRGTEGRISGLPVTQGYMVQVATGQSYINIYSTTHGQGYTLIATGQLGFTLQAGTIYHIRFQVVGTTLKARCWADGVTEPTTWMVTGTSSLFSSGKLWAAFGGFSPELKSFNLYHIQYNAPTIDPSVPRNFTTSGEVTVTPKERSGVLQITTVDDANNDGTMNFRYKETNSTSWTAVAVFLVPGAKNITYELTGLQPATSYNVEVTWQDPDGVYGANPKNIVFTTTSTGVYGNTISVSDVTTNQVKVTADYLRDDDSDATAELSHRLSGMETKVVEDYFVDEDDGEYLQNTTSNLGGDWIKHPTMSATVHAIRKNMRFYVNTKTTSDEALYYNTNASPTHEYDVRGTFYAPKLNGNTGVAGRMSTTDETYYGAGIDGANNRWEIFKSISGTKTVLATAPFDTLLDVVYDLRLIIRDTYKALVVNDIEVARTNDNDITSTGHGGYYSTGISEGLPDNQFNMSSITISYRSVAGEWISTGLMTIDRVEKKVSSTVTGLSPDAVYEFRVTFTDADGVVGTNPLLIMAQTTGASVALSAMGASPSATSAIIDVFYNHDTNNNAYIDFQYKSVMENLWTTVPFMNARTDRSIKKFSHTLTNLMPSLTYEVKVTVTDPDGIMENSPETLNGLFTTEGFVSQDQKKNKSFIWKVYGKKEEYLGTIPDAPEPEFSLHQNGGVTDLSFTLHRSMNEIASQHIIDFQHRVDVWALDPSSEGMGPNMIANEDCDASIGGWLMSPITTYNATGGPDGSSALQIQATSSTQYETMSNPIEIKNETPLVIKCVAKASGAKLRMYVRSYDVNDIVIDSSDQISDTVGNEWQNLRIEYTPPEGTSYVRVILRNTGRGTMFADKFSVLSKEILVYRGKIESYTPSIDENGEKVDIEVLGLASLLSDDYIDFLQFVEQQPQKDIEAKRINYGAKDPADMMKFIIDYAKRANPSFTLYYTAESIRYTGQLAQYTIRDQQIRASMDKVRNLCPSGWHYYIEPDGLVVLRGPEHAKTHLLRMGVEILRFEVEKSIRNLKNYIRVKGRQDEDKSETDGYGSINYIAFDQKSIDRYGKRTLFFRDAQVTDPETAKMIGDGRLDEHNREEQRARCYIPDEKGYFLETGSLRGYNIESFRPGDNVVIVDPVGGPRYSYWDQFRWDEDAWDMSNAFMPLPDPVPIVTIQNHGTYAQLDISERPPSSVGDFSRLFRWMADKEAE